MSKILFDELHAGCSSFIFNLILELTRFKFFDYTRILFLPILFDLLVLDALPGEGMELFILHAWQIRQSSVNYGKIDTLNASPDLENRKSCSKEECSPFSCTCNTLIYSLLFNLTLLDSDFMLVESIISNDT